MTRVTAIFERGVFRPTEPVCVHDGAQVVLSFEESPPPQLGNIAVTIGSHGLPVIHPPQGSRPITNEDVARGLEDL